MNKRVNPRRQPASHADVKRAKQEVARKSVRFVQVMILSALADKEGWDREQMQHLWRHVMDLTDSVSRGYVSVADLSNTLWEEYGVDLRD